MSHLDVRRVGAQCLVQDLGRPGWAHLGVPRAGALDLPAAALANRLVGNTRDRAVLEVLLGGLEVTASDSTWVAVTGAPAPAWVDARAVSAAEPVRLAAGATLRLGAPATGLRSYVAVAGGIEVSEVLGSRSTDTLAGVGPPPVTAGTRLPVGPATGSPRALDTPRGPRAGPLRLDPGPRADWFERDVLAHLCGAAYTVRAQSDRIGLRLDGPSLERVRSGELASEGMVCGAVQVPPDGLPIVFLADHPVTGGYPVVAVVRADDLWRCAQVRPGEQVRFVRG